MILVVQFVLFEWLGSTDFTLDVPAEGKEELFYHVSSDNDYFTLTDRV